jgi:tape measure domain-containing protein
MADLGTLFARLMLDTAGFSKGLDSAMGSLNGLVAMAAAVETALVGTFAAAAAEGLRFAAELEQLDIAFTTFLGSAEKSAAFLDEMKQFAAQTPFAFEDVVRGTQRLMAMGFAAEDSIPVLAAVGDRISALGKGGAEIDRVIRALGQMSGKGKVFTQEMNQLNEVGLDAWGMLTREIGKTEAEARALVESRQISAATFLKAFMHSTASEVGGMMELQSQTLMGLFSTLKDNVSFGLADAFKPLAEALKPLIKSMGEAMPVLLAAFAPFIEGLGIAAVGLGKLLDGFNALPAPAQKVLAAMVAIGSATTAAFAAGIVALGGFGFAIVAVTMAVTALDAALLPVVAVLVLVGSIFATLLPPLAAITAGIMLLATEATVLSYVLPAAFQAAWEIIGYRFQPAIEAVLSLWQRLMTAITGSSGTFGSLGVMLDALKTKFIEVFSVSTIQAALAAIWRGFSNLISGALTALVKLVTKLQPFFEAAGMGEIGRKALSGLLNAQVELGFVSEAVGASVRDAMSQLANDILGVGEGLKKSFSDYGAALDDLETAPLKPKGGAAPTTEAEKEEEEAATGPLKKVLKTLTAFDKLDPIAKRTAEAIQEDLDAIKAYFKDLGLQLYAGLGQVGTTIDNAIEGAKTAGPWGALAAVFVDLLSNSQTMADITATLDEAFGRISDAFGGLLAGVHIVVGNALLLVAQLAEGLAPVFELLSGTFSRLGAIFIPLAYVIEAIVSAIQTAIGPLQAAAPILDKAFEFLFTLFQGVAVIILGIVYAIQKVWNFLLQGVINVLEVFSGIFDGLEDTIASLEGMKADTDATSDAINELMSTSYAEALAMSAAAVAADETTEALDAMTASLVNVPAGYKVALARFAATAAVVRSASGSSDPYNNFIPAMASGGVVLGPTLALVGERGPEAVVPLDRLGSMGGGTTIIIENLAIQANDPEALFDKLERIAKRRAFQRSGNPLASAQPFSSGRR